MIKHQIKGNANQMVVCQVDPGQTVYCEAGKFLWKTANVSIETRFSTPETPGQWCGHWTSSLSSWLSRPQTGHVPSYHAMWR